MCLRTETITQETNKPRAPLWTTARSRPVPFSFPAPVAGRTMMFPPQKQRNVRQVLIRGMNPGPIAPYARIIPLDQAAKCPSHRRQLFQEPRRQYNLLSHCHIAPVAISQSPDAHVCSTCAGQSMLEATSAMREREPVQRMWTSALALISQANVPPPGLEPGSLGGEPSNLTS